MSSHPENPIARGKGKLVANLMLDGKSNEEIREFWKSNGLEEKMGELKGGMLHSVRYDLKVRGLIDEYGHLIKQSQLAQSDIPPSSPPPSPSASQGEGANPPSLSALAPREEFQRHPEWDLLTLDQIGHIADPSLRARILNYKTEISKVRQELKPEYATRGEIDLLRNEISGKMGDIQETLNTLISKFNDPESEVEQEPEEAELEEEDQEAAAPTKKPIKLATAVNRLEAAEQEEAPQEGGGDDDLIEVESGVIIRKHIGFTAKSVMYYEIDRAGGFQGNLADYVNSCIEDAHKGRDIQLAVVERKMIR